MSTFPNTWVSTTLEDVYTFHYGKSLTKQARTTSGSYPVLGSSGVVGSHTAFLVQGPVVIVGRKGAAGSVIFCKENCWPIDTTYFVKPPDEIDVSFAALHLQFLQLNRLEKSTAIPGLSRDDAYALRVAVPPTREQRRIAAKIEELFSELDKGVESLTTARDQLKAYRQSILKHAFEGRLTEEWRARNPEEGQTPSQRLASIRADAERRFAQAHREWEINGKKGARPTTPTSLDESEPPDFSALPTLPKGWTYLPFGALAYSIRNGISKKPNETGTLRIFRISAVRPMVFDMTDFRQIDDEIGYRSYRLKRGDVVFTRYNGSRAYVGVAAEFRSDEDYVYPDKLIRCEVESQLIDPGYIEKVVNCGAPRAFIESRIRTTAGQAGISGADLKVMPIPVCSIEEQREINQLLEVRLSCIAQLEADVESRFLQAEALRYSILKQAFSGQLVAQDPTDEPASVLLERIRTERKNTAMRKPLPKTKKRKNEKENAA